MAVEIAPSPDRVRLSPISWPAVFASLAVGISVMLLLTLAGIAFGLTAVDPTAETPRAITIGAATWQAQHADRMLSLVLSMIGGAMVLAGHAAHQSAASRVIPSHRRLPPRRPRGRRACWPSELNI